MKNTQAKPRHEGRVEMKVGELREHCVAVVNTLQARKLNPIDAAFVAKVVFEDLCKQYDIKFESKLEVTNEKGEKVDVGN